MIERLRHNLTDAGKAIELLTAPDGMRLLALPFGGRVLALSAPGSEVNFFWTHAALASAETARVMYASGGWPNSGGARTGLAPEIDFFYPAYPAQSPYVVPAPLDPGAYRVTRATASIQFANSGVLRSYRSSVDVAFHLTQDIEFTENPLSALTEEYSAGEVDIHPV